MKNWDLLVHYESMIMNRVHICVQYVSIVCLNVPSTLFSYFSLTKDEDQKECHGHFRLKRTLKTLEPEKSKDFRARGGF